MFGLPYRLRSIRTWHGSETLGSILRALEPKDLKNGKNLKVIISRYQNMNIPNRLWGIRKSLSRDSRIYLYGSWAQGTPKKLKIFKALLSGIIIGINQIDLGQSENHGPLATIYKFETFFRSFGPRAQRIDPRDSASRFSDSP